MLIKAVLFDVDSTLVDSVDLHAQARVDAFKEFGTTSASARGGLRLARAVTSSCPSS